ncbi:nucleotide sugar dehydrogenase [Amycolatopsis cihanbeyliensis]|uniref:UDP-N-acetyl-D-mannosaminuronic acid dehydrogenase n=1 Tax=Amycolatopsis cihanbeyliensis TaxID=1128664 RepID=A0A542DRV2_AMYCI|nr:nucleotide sugar dehydrogenase [Amycolatopsis cihanbeyliensis]TQJ05810.1 UDP-N-acetyl-D-mannosaminuronic acid dehydrogenase [Amycolatopsis cihanbeyliensis]
MKIGIIGMGYVGLTLTAALARAGHQVHGVDTSPAVLDSLARGKPHIYEPGVAEVFAEHTGGNILVSAELPPATVDVAIICVSTPVDEATHEPYLGNLAGAAEHVALHCTPGTLVVVRSTVPVGTSREVVLPPLLDAWGSAHLVMAPERTIQGQALHELVELPQVVGGLDEVSLERGLALFGGFAREVVGVSSLETAELVKLANNCHTDVIYSFGNEVALLTERLGLDPLEVIRATNLHYPRPDIARPGYVGGGCLSKDPYIMLAGAERNGHLPPVIGAARALNERLPVHVARRVRDLMAPSGQTLAVLGWAYKGQPPTDDMRGAPIASMMPVFATAGLRVLGHDPLVSTEVIRAHGGEPVDLVRCFREADAVLLITDHPEYRELDMADLLGGSPVRLVYDSWRILDPVRITGRGVRYAGLGYEPSPTVVAVGG